jgi:hypothetical protein
VEQAAIPLVTFHGVTKPQKGGQQHSRKRTKNRLFYSGFRISSSGAWFVGRARQDVQPIEIARLIGDNGQRSMLPFGNVTAYKLITRIKRYLHMCKYCRRVGGRCTYPRTSTPELPTAPSIRP